LAGEIERENCATSLSSAQFIQARPIACRRHRLGTNSPPITAAFVALHTRGCADGWNCAEGGCHHNGWCADGWNSAEVCMCRRRFSWARVEGLCADGPDILRSQAQVLAVDPLWRFVLVLSIIFMWEKLLIFPTEPTRSFVHGKTYVCHFEGWSTDAAGLRCIIRAFVKQSVWGTCSTLQGSLSHIFIGAKGKYMYNTYSYIML
jgi:hypothetical protein